MSRRKGPPRRDHVLVLSMRAEGKTFQQIADRLGITRQGANTIWRAAMNPRRIGAAPWEYEDEDNNPTVNSTPSADNVLPNPSCQHL